MSKPQKPKPYSLNVNLTEWTCKRNGFNLPRCQNITKASCGHVAVQYSVRRQWGYFV